MAWPRPVAAAEGMVTRCQCNLHPQLRAVFLVEMFKAFVIVIELTYEFNF